MKKIKLQHYVPQFYLESFSNKKESKPILECLSKVNNEQLTVNIKHICCEKYFNDKEEDVAQELEKFLAILEGQSKLALIDLIKQKNPDNLNIEDRKKIALFVATQYIRTKEKREQIEDSVKQIIQRLSKYKLAPELEIQVRKVKENLPSFIKEIHLDLFRNISKIADIIFQMKWILLINKTNTPFWTSDNPIAIHNEQDHFPYGNLGLIKLGIELHFPLNPMLCLVMCDPISFQFEPSIKILRDFRYIIREQSYQVNQSTRFIFSNNPNFSFAKKMIKDNPEIADIKRKRIKVN